MCAKSCPHYLCVNEQACTCVYGSSLHVSLSDIVFSGGEYSLLYFSPNSGQWCLALANVFYSSKSTV